MAGTNKKKRRKKKSRLPLIVLLALLCGLGAWNYRQNLEAESAAPRPYAGYSDADLEALASGYRAEVEALASRYERASGRRVDARDGASLGDQIREFERVQRQSRTVRGLGYQISERETSLRKIEEEQAQRRLDAHRVATFLRRVFTARI